MTTTKVYCDRCGEEVIYPIERTLHLSGIYEEDKYDLCDSCYEELHSWFEMDKIKCDEKEREEQRMSKSILIIDTPETCSDCPVCIFTADEKNYIGYCNTSNEDYYCKALDRFMKYDKVDGGIDILGKPADCPLKVESEE